MYDGPSQLFTVTLDEQAHRHVKVKEISVIAAETKKIVDHARIQRGRGAGGPDPLPEKSQKYKVA